MLDIAAPYRPLFETLDLTSFDSIAGRFTAGPPAATGVLVRGHTLAVAGPAPLDLDLFFKQYDYRPASWRFLGRSSKARREYQNYRVFLELGIPCAQPVACGEARDPLGRIRRAFIITRAIPDASTLLEFVARHCPLGAGGPARNLRSALRRQLAAMTRRLHQAGFFHNDLVWRNILATWTPPSPPSLWWIDCPRGAFHRWPVGRRRRVWKDLASLDKSASKCCTRAERVAFLLEYLGERRLTPSAKRLIREVQAYRRARWPEDWHRT